MHVQEDAGRVLGRVEGGDAGVDEEVALFLHARRPPSRSSGLMPVSRAVAMTCCAVSMLLESAFGCGSAARRRRRAFLQNLEQALAAGRLGVDADLERIASVPGRRHEAAQALDGLLPERRQAAAGKVEAVLHHQAGTRRRCSARPGGCRAGRRAARSRRRRTFLRADPPAGCRRRSAASGTSSWLTRLGISRKSGSETPISGLSGERPALIAITGLLRAAIARLTHEGAAILDGIPDVEQDRARARVGGEGSRALRRSRCPGCRRARRSARSRPCAQRASRAPWCRPCRAKTKPSLPGARRSARRSR